MRFYGFKVNEIVDKENPLLDMDIDPKLGWALRNLHLFPANINTMDYQLLMRIPGIGIQSAKKIYAARKFGTVHWEQLKKMGIAVNRARYFVHTGNDFEHKDLQPFQIKQMILQESNSKYHADFSPQLKLF